MIIKVFPDKEKAKSILKMAASREEFLKEEKIKVYSTIIVENYYETIKELCIAVILTEGQKAIGENAHKELIDFMQKYKELDDFEIKTMQNLRIRRNKSFYEGKQIEPIYLENNKDILIKIISKLKRILEKKIS